MLREADEAAAAAASAAEAARSAPKADWAAMAMASVERERAREREPARAAWRTSASGVSATRKMALGGLVTAVRKEDDVDAEGNRIVQ